MAQSAGGSQKYDNDKYDDDAHDDDDDDDDDDKYDDDDNDKYDDDWRLLAFPHQRHHNPECLKFFCIKTRWHQQDSTGKLRD